MIQTPLHVIADCAGPEQAAHVSQNSWTPSLEHSSMHAMGSVDSYGAIGTLHGPGLGSHDLHGLACMGVVYGPKGGNRVMTEWGHA